VHNNRLVAELAASKARVIDLEGQLDAATGRIVTLSKLSSARHRRRKRESRNHSSERAEGADRFAAAPGRRAGSSGSAARQRRGAWTMDGGILVFGVST